MRSTVLILIVAALAAVLVGCGGNGNGSGGGSNIGTVSLEGVWVADNGTDVLIFLSNGRYYYSTGNENFTGAVEYGTYTWNDNLGNFRATPSYDQSNTVGFSSMTSGITMTKVDARLSIRNGSNPAICFDKVLVDKSDPLAGAWIDEEDNGFYVVAFTSDGHIYTADYNIEQPRYQYGTFTKGSGTYTYNYIGGSQGMGSDSYTLHYSVTNSSALTIEGENFSRLSTD